MPHRLIVRSCAPLVLLAACSPNNSGKLQAEVGDLPHALAERADANAELVAACGAVASTGAALSRLPYLQKVSSTAADLMWAGQGMRGGSVAVTTPEGETVQSVPAEVEGRAPEEVAERFIAKMRDLSPDTIYCYEVRDASGEPRLGRVGFRTAPETPAARFIVLGDSGDDTPDQAALTDQLGTVPFDFMIHVGDLAYPSAGYAELDATFFGYYAQLLMHHPVFPVAGNHEYRADEAAPFRAVFDLPNNERWYSFDWADVHFVALDTEREDDEQVRWLETDLARNDKRWTVAFLHRPAYSSGFHGSDSEVRGTFSPIFERHEVDVVFQGHDHHYERTKAQNGVRYFVTGGGGAGTYPVTPSEISAVAQEVVQFLYVTADEQELVVHAIDATGQEFDQLVLTST